MCRTRCRLGPLSIFPLPHPSLRRPPAPTRVPGPPVSQMCVKDHPRAPRSPPRPILDGLGSVHALVPALWIDDATVSPLSGDSSRLISNSFGLGGTLRALKRQGGNGPTWDFY